jgi:hypothetical protein
MRSVLRNCAIFGATLLLLAAGASGNRAIASVTHPAGLDAIPLSGWDSFTVTPGWTDFVFATSNGEVNPQTPAHIELLLESSAWFNQPLSISGSVDGCATGTAGCDLGTGGSSATSDILANVFYMHFGGGAFAFLYPTLISNFSVSGAGSGLSNLRAFNGAISAVPLPAALPLLGTAFGGLGLLTWLRRRKISAAI